MAINLTIFHKTGAGPSQLQLPSGYWHLGTCLRSLVITDLERQTPHGLEDYDRISGGEAYQFFLQVICGLESPLLGETEIFGQFKNFIKDHRDQLSVQLLEVANLWSKDAKAIRSHYLQNLGCTSYGSLIRKFIKNNRQDVTILGAGSLAQDLVPWLTKEQRRVQVFTRNPDKYHQWYQQNSRAELLSYQQWCDRANQKAVIIVAAPLSADQLHQQFGLRDFRRIFDLRGESKNDPIDHHSVISLGELFANIEASKKRAESIKQKAMLAIKECRLSLQTIEKQRPFGWDDLWNYA